MKAHKKALEKTDMFGRILYNLGCFKYTEKLSGFYRKNNLEYSYKFHPRWYHPVMIVIAIASTIWKIGEVIVSIVREIYEGDTIYSGSYLVYPEDKLKK